MYRKILERLEASPVIAAVKEKNFERALASPVDVLFMLGIGILNARERIEKAHQAGKYVFVHIDLAEGIGKDRHGIAYLADCGADGIISTKSTLLRYAKEYGLATVQRFFAYDTQGVVSIDEVLSQSNPDIIEIMPGVIGKIIERFAHREIPLIAGGLIETKAEVTAALYQGALAVSTGKETLWYL